MTLLIWSFVIYSIISLRYPFSNDLAGQVQTRRKCQSVQIRIQSRDVQTKTQNLRWTRLSQVLHPWSQISHSAFHAISHPRSPPTSLTINDFLLQKKKLTSFQNQKPTDIAARGPHDLLIAVDFIKYRLEIIRGLPEHSKRILERTTLVFICKFQRHSRNGCDHSWQQNNRQRAINIKHCQ